MKAINFFLILTISAILSISTNAQGNKNVLFISIDDLRPELNCYGSKHMITPNIDKLAQDGMLFNNAYVQQAICTPSRISMLTGLRPATTQLFGLNDELTKNRPDIVSMPKAFKNQGYTSIGIGKLYHHKLDDADAFSETPARSWTNNNNIGKTGKPATFIVPDNLKQNCSDYKNADLAIQKLEQYKNEQFFIGVGFNKPHLPFVAPQQYWDLYDRNDIVVPTESEPEGTANSYPTTEWQELRGYDNIPPIGTDLPEWQAKELIHGYRACVSFIDAQVGRVIQKLDDLGLRENTIIVLWSDHGWKLGDYGDWCKHTNFEIDTRIPLIIDVPGLEDGQTCNAMVEAVDLFPTLADYAGITPSSNLDGMSMIPLLQNPNANWKEAAFSQYPRYNNTMGTAVRTKDYRYVEYKDHDLNKIYKTELYAHSNNTPLEIEYTNLYPNNNSAGNSDAYQNVVDEMRALLELGWDGVKQAATLSITEILDTKYEFLLYPNPTKESITLNNKTYQDATVNIYDLMGRRVKSFVLKANSIQTESLRDGQYIVNIDNNISYKVIVRN